MQQTQVQQQPTSGLSGNNNNWRFRLLLAIFLILLACVVPYVLYRRGVIDLLLLGILLASITIAVTILVVVFDDIVTFLTKLWSKFVHRSQKPTLLLSYVINDFQWVKWLRMELTRVGYGDKIFLREWNITRDDPTDFKEEMQNASEGVNFIISIASKDYLKRVSSSEKGFQEFKRRVNRRSIIFANVIDMNKEKLDREPDVQVFFTPPTAVRRKGKGGGTPAASSRAAALLHLLQNKLAHRVRELKHHLRIDLMESKLDADKARERFLAGLPLKVRIHYQQPTSSGSIDDETRFPGNLPTKWNIPTPSPFFTGREDILKRLYSALDKMQTLRKPQALTGLQGIGTSEIAKEFAYRYHGKYTSGLWIRMAPDEDRENDLREISRLLDLRTTNGTVQELQESLLEWLNIHDNWILVLNKCEDTVIANSYIPGQKRGHIILTTPINDLIPEIMRVPVGEMKEEEGTLFLLRKAGKIRPDQTLEEALQEDYKIALEITREMGGFPKALFHAGFIIGEGTPLQEFYEAYTKQRNELTEKFKEYFGADVYAWYVVFNRFSGNNPWAAKLLRFCAFLHPEAIPIEVIKKASIYNPALSSTTGHDLDLLKSIMDLKRYCLLERDGTGSLSMNRVVQTVLRDEMDLDIRKSFAEQAVRAVNDAFPDPRYVDNTGLRMYVSNAIMCSELIQEYRLEFPEAALLLVKLAEYKIGQGDSEAQEYITRATDILSKITAQAVTQTVGQQP